MYSIKKAVLLRYGVFDTIKFFNYIKRTKMQLKWKKHFRPYRLHFYDQHFSCALDKSTNKILRNLRLFSVVTDEVTRSYKKVTEQSIMV